MTSRPNAYHLFFDGNRRVGREKKSNMNETGFPLLSKRLANLPDCEGFIFRGFHRLSARNLLHLEAKLAFLEHRLEQTDTAAKLGDSESLRSLRSWEAFEENARRADRPEKEQMELNEEIRTTLASYRKS